MIEPWANVVTHNFWRKWNFLCLSNGLLTGNSDRQKQHWCGDAVLFCFLNQNKKLTFECISDDVAGSDLHIWTAPGLKLRMYINKDVIRTN